MIDPIVQQVLLGTIIYGIFLCFLSGGFQIYRKEKKSAAVLLTTGTVILILTITVRVIRTHGL